MTVTTRKTAAKKAAAPDTNGHKITTKIITVTPAKAEEMLTHSKHNRKLSWRDVDHWAREMTEGRWHLNGDRFSALQVSNSEIVNFVDEHPELLDAVKFAQAHYRDADVPSLGVAAY